MLKLLLLFVCVRLCACECDEPREPLVSALAAAGRPRAALCLRGAACAGALWGRHWLLARASCLRAPRGGLGHAGASGLAGATVLLHQHPDSCHNITAEMSPIRVMARFEHPQFSWASEEWGWGWGWGPAPAHAHAQFDAALVLLAAPAAVPPAGNRSRAMLALPKLAAWLRWLPEQFPSAREHPPAPRPPRLTRWRMASTPLRLLASTVLLPLAALLLLFALALRVSWGQPEDVPYDALERAGGDGPGPARGGEPEPAPLAEPEGGDVWAKLPAASFPSAPAAV